MKLHSLCIALVAALGASAARADSTVNISWQGKDLTGLQLTAFDDSYSTTGPVVTTSYRTTALNYTNNASHESFIAYCIEPAESNTKTAKDYTASVFSGPRVSLVQGLFSQYYDGLSTPTSKAAFQVALWEIMRESGSTLDASAGSFRVGATYGSVATLANDYLANAASYSGPALFTLTRLSYTGQQDLITASRIATAVPEPMSGAMLMSGLAVLGLLARRRMPR
ncbi:PEP-CTERM sorting domain-containing protein [Roseateles sp.]|uniref:PEP-CTERM sorting domain-containing protein n=1 Tax=Roseateles sp. TaxID=1971397 RepID=UPI00392B9B58